MYTDNLLLLASSETLSGQNGGNTCLGEQSVNLVLDTNSLSPGGGLNSLGNLGHMDELELSVTATADVVATSATDPARTLEVQLVSLPISLSLLADGSGGATAGKLTSIASVVTNSTNDDLTINGHGLPLGTPIFLTSIATTTNISANVVYYVVPTGVNTFRLALNLANALAGTTIDLQTGNGTATVNFIPFIHMTTGAIPIPALGAGQRYIARNNPYALGLSGRQALLGGSSVTQALGAGPSVATATATYFVPQAGRYLALRYVASNAITAGAITAVLSPQTGEGRSYTPSAFVVA